jgi:hypothetical protein
MLATGWKVVNDTTWEFTPPGGQFITASLHAASVGAIWTTS